MAGYLTDSHIKAFTGALMTHFSTFKKQVIFHKEPTKTISVSNTSNSPIFGYGNTSQPTTSFSYTPVSGVYDCQVSITLDQKANELEEVKNLVGKGRIRIKVEKNCRDFIEDGRKTERIEFAGQSYNSITFDGIQDYLGLKYYCYFLERTL